MIELYPPDISIQLHSYKNKLGYLYRETPPLSGPGSVLVDLIRGIQYNKTRSCLYT